MLDIELIRKKPDVVELAAKSKNVEVDVTRLLEVDTEKRSVQQELDELRSERKRVAGQSQGGTDKEAIEKGKKIKEQLAEAEGRYDKLAAEFTGLMEALPNIPSEDTPLGRDEEDNTVLRQVGEVPEFSFTPQEHFELGAALDVLEFERAAEVAGSRFVYLKGPLVWLQFGLIQSALSVLTDPKTLSKIATEAGLEVSETPFVPVIVPVMMRPEVMQAMGRLEPREERYHIESDDLYLIGSAEHTLGPLHASETLDFEQLPVRYVGYSTSFRREAGTYGKDTKGILRLHHFDKLEIESFTAPDDSLAEQNFIVAIQEYLMQQLKLPYQVVLKCTGDMGTPNARAIDIETWLPGQGKYRETHTSDLMTDWQARRLKTKVKDAMGSSVYAHMNDATVFAMGRTLVAIMENYQQEDGSIVVPEVLQKFVPFTEIKKGR